MAKRKREIKGHPSPAAPHPQGGGDAPSPGREWRPSLSRDLMENILLVVLLLYIILLGVGTAGELFEQDMILSLPLFQ